jgi:hypothetical protein
MTPVLKLPGRKMDPEDTPRDSLEHLLDEFEGLRDIMNMQTWEEEAVTEYSKRYDIVTKYLRTVYLCSLKMDCGEIENLRALKAPFALGKRLSGHINRNKPSLGLLTMPTKAAGRASTRRSSVSRVFSPDANFSRVFAPESSGGRKSSFMGMDLTDSGPQEDPGVMVIEGPGGESNACAWVPIKWLEFLPTTSFREGFQSHLNRIDEEYRSGKLPRLRSEGSFFVDSGGLRRPSGGSPTSSNSSRSGAAAAQELLPEASELSEPSETSKSSTSPYPNTMQL